MPVLREILAGETSGRDLGDPPRRRVGDALVSSSQGFWNRLATAQPREAAAKCAGTLVRGQYACLSSCLERAPTAGRCPSFLLCLRSVSLATLPPARLHYDAAF